MGSLISATDLDWPIVDGVCGPGGPSGVTPEQWAAAKDAAVAWLWALSGRQFGTWLVTWRPEWTNPPPVRGRSSSLLGSALTGTGLAVAGCRPCAADPRSTVLPGPVVSVTEVLVDGAALDPAVYLVEGDQLLRVDGADWPVSQDTTLPATTVGSWQVTYTRGRPVPGGGQAAAGMLACELAGALIPNGKCALPGNVTSVVRSGVTISKQIDQLNLGFTGLGAVDQWARSVNPKTLPSEPAVWSPDLDPTLYRKPAIGVT